MDKTLLFIVNPRAGKTKSSAPLFDAVATFGRAGYLVRVMLTQAAGDAARFAAQWGGDYDLVVCAGGDGTLNETLSGLMQLENRPPVGYLPNGSTNDFAASLRIPSSVQQAARAAVEGTPHPLDLGAHNDRYFSYVASFGAFTKASYSASQETKNALGHLAYLIEGVKNLQTLRPYPMRFEADGQLFEGDYLFGAISNSTSIAGLVKLDGDLVKLNDGLLEVLLIRYPQSLDELGRIAISLNMQNYDNPAITLIQARRVRVENPEHTPFTLDGEYGSDDQEIVIENVPGAIRLLN